MKKFFSLVVFLSVASTVAADSILEITKEQFGESKVSPSGEKYKTTPEFVQSDQIQIEVLPQVSGFPSGTSSERKQWYKVIDPNMLPVKVSWTMNNVEYVAVFDNLAEFSCTDKSRYSVLKFKSMPKKDEHELKQFVTLPCVRYYNQYGVCPQEAVLMARVKTSDNKYLYNTKHFYFCVTRPGE